jgi:hypothetical protein
MYPNYILLIQRIQSDNIVSTLFVAVNIYICIIIKLRLTHNLCLYTCKLRLLFTFVRPGCVFPGKKV